MIEGRHLKLNLNSVAMCIELGEGYTYPAKVTDLVVHFLGKYPGPKSGWVETGGGVAASKNAKKKGKVVLSSSSEVTVCAGGFEGGARVDYECKLYINDKDLYLIGFQGGDGCNFYTSDSGVLMGNGEDNIDLGFGGDYRSLGVYEKGWTWLERRTDGRREGKINIGPMTILKSLQSLAGFTKKKQAARDSKDIKGVKDALATMALVVCEAMRDKQILWLVDGYLAGLPGYEEISREAILARAQNWSKNTEGGCKDILIGQGYQERKANMTLLEKNLKEEPELSQREYK
ncbi:ribosome-inactivating family protein [Microbulbifer sp. SSSA002]|uniref:ribosome-inactivating family protein n=1 Tax=Microbulbifer sp. SSSA002 TaxID=3243376 RepID=UPI0040393644